MYHYSYASNARPVEHPPRRVTPEEQHSERREIEKILKRLIEPSVKPLGLSPAMVPKPAGSTRYSCNFVPLNYLTVKDSYLVPGRHERLFGLTA